MSRPADTHRRLMRLLLDELGYVAVVRLADEEAGYVPAATKPAKPSPEDHEEASRAMRRVLSRRGRR